MLYGRLDVFNKTMNGVTEAETAGGLAAGGEITLHV